MLSVRRAIKTILHLLALSIEALLLLGKKASPRDKKHRQVIYLVY